MKRVVGYAVGVLVVVLLMLVPLLGIGSGSGADAQAETATISDYDARFVVDDRGTLRATETLRVDFPVYKHGIFRFFDLRDPLDSHVRYVPEDISVTRDGRSDQLSLTHEGRGRYVVARIGDPDQTIDGAHTYVIRYTVPGALAPAASGGRGSLFYWNLVPGGWQMPIQRSTLSATLPSTLPSAPGDVRCAVGNGSTSGCSADVSGDTLTVSTGDLAPLTPVTVQAPLAAAAPGQTRLPWPLALDPVLGHSLPRAVVFGVLALLALIGGALAARAVREPDPAYPLMYAPPEGIGPAQGAYLMDERVGDEAFAATMLEMGERGVARIRRITDGWQVGGTDGDPARLDAVTRHVAESLGVEGGSWFEAKEGDEAGGRRLQATRNTFESEVKAWARGAGLVELTLLPRLGALAVIGGGIVAAYLFFTNVFDFSLSGLPFGVFAVMAFPLLDKRSASFRTRAGREAWSRVGGFRRVLGTTSSEARFDFSGRQDLYLTYVPWAVAFGVADVWAQKYRVEVHQEPPVPAYFLGGYVPVGGSVGGSMGGFSESFNDSVGSAIAAYQATQRSSSSGSGGFSGGFSGGGGGGGGGGGSW